MAKKRQHKLGDGDSHLASTVEELDAIVSNKDVIAGLDSSPLSTGLIADTVYLFAIDSEDSSKLKIIVPFKARFVNYSAPLTNPLIEMFDIPITSGISHTCPINTNFVLAVGHNNGSIIFDTREDPGDFDQNDWIVLGHFYTNDTLIGGSPEIVHVSNYPYLGFNYGKSITELALAFGPSVRMNDGTLTMHTDGTYTRSEGKYFRFNSRKSVENHHIGTDEETHFGPSGEYFLHFNNTGAFTLDETVDTNNYCLSGVTTAIPDNHWSILYITHWYSSNEEGLQRIDQYFANKNDALVAMTMPCENIPDLLRGALTEVLIFKKGTTFDNPEDYELITLNKYGIMPSGDPLIASLQSSGVIDWNTDDILAVNIIDDAKFDIGEFRIAGVDYDVDGNPVKLVRTISAQTALTTTYLSTHPITIIVYNWKTDSIVQRTTGLKRSEMADLIHIGILYHFDNALITEALTLPKTHDTSIDLAGELYTSGPRKLEGFKLTANGANLKVDIATGQSFRIGANSGNRSNPNFITYTATPTVSMRKFHRNSSNKPVDEGLSTLIDTTNIEDGAGGIIALEDGKFGNMYAVLYPYRDNGMVAMLRGDKGYDNLTDAELGHIGDFPEDIDGLEKFLLIGGISFQKGITDLTDAIEKGKASIIEPSPFGTIDAVPGYTALVVRSYNLNDLGNSGTSYLAGFYEAPVTDANLDNGTTTQTYGSANKGHGAHAFIVASGVGTVNAGQVGLKVSGTSILDDGTITSGDFEVLTDNITTLSTNEYVEGPKKWLGIITYELYTVSGTPTTYSLDFNYGFVKYEDFSNNNFVVNGFQVLVKAQGSDTGFNIILQHHNNIGWIYSATAFEPGSGSEILNMYDDYYDGVTHFNQLVGGEYFAYKRVGISKFIDGASNDGIIIKVVTGSNNTIQNGTAIISVKLQA